MPTLPPTQAMLNFANHDRDVAGLSYVYPVVSRRAGGVSVGINLNPNRACNWACVYCQVPNLQRGVGPAIDLAQLREELHWMLGQLLQGDYMQTQVPESLRVLRDLAFSGDGEPTSSPQFAEVVAEVMAIKQHWALQAQKLVLITNGSCAHQPAVQQAVAQMASANGEVWFKIDRADAESVRMVNQVPWHADKVLAQLQALACRCPTWIQTCWFAMDGAPPSPSQTQAYLDFLARLQAQSVPVLGVLLYSLARPSMQPQAARLAALPAEALQALAARIRALGLAVQVV